MKDLDEGVEERLRSLDQRFLAAAAPRAARAVDALQSRARSASRAVDTARAAARDVDLKDLNALDDKYATKGLLGFFREVPQLMAVVVGIMFIAGTMVAARELRDRETRGDQQTVVAPDGTPSSPSSAGGTLGPPVGSNVGAYLTLAANGLTAAAKSAPDDPRLALVSLSSYYRPEQAASIMSGYVAERAYLRAGSSAGKDAAQLPLNVDGDLLGSLKAFYTRTSKGQRDAAAQYQELADTTAVGDPYKAFYTKYATLSRKQAQAYGSNCACVFALVIRATPSQLLALRSRPGIRALEVAGAGLGPADLDIVPLLPEVKGVVPEPTVPEDPPS